MRRVQAEADRAVAMAGVDLIKRAREPFPTGQLGRGEGHQQIPAAVLQQTHIAQMHAEADDRAWSCAAPEAHPQGPVKPQEDRGILRRKAADVSGPDPPAMKLTDRLKRPATRPSRRSRAVAFSTSQRPTR